MDIIHSKITKNILIIINVFFLCAVIFHAGSAGAAQTEKSFTTAKRFDVKGLLTGVISPDPDGNGPLKYQAIRNTYNSNSQLVKTETGELASWQNETISPSNWTSFTIIKSTVMTYNSRGLLDSTSHKNALGVTINFTQKNYDSHGRVECEVKRLNSATFDNLSYSACSPTNDTQYGYDRVNKYEYDNIGQVTHFYRAYGTSLQQLYRVNSYDPVKKGLLNTVTDANGNVTEYEYDAFGQLEYVYYPTGGGYSQYGYDVDGNMTSERKRNGSIFTYAYDKNNRMRSKSSAVGQPVIYSYDLRGLQLSAKFSYSGEGVTNTYDAIGNLKTTTTSMGTLTNNRTRTITLGYDLNSNLSKITYPDNVYFNYIFDGNDRLGQVTNNTGVQFVKFSYSQKGAISDVIRNNGVGAGTVYSRGDINRLDSMSDNFSGTNYDNSYNYSYNPANQLSSIGYSNNAFRYTQNNNVLGDYVVNDLNQYTNIAGNAFSYDSNGNLTNDGVSSTSYTYDNENRLISSSGTNKNATFIYDPLGRLYEATINGNKKQFLYYGDKLAAEYNTAGSLTERYIHGVNADHPLFQFTGNGTDISSATFLHQDHQGSTVAQSNYLGGLTQILSYDAYGIPATSNVGRFQYTGQLAFNELGLYHYKARMYHPKLGRFLQTDPVGYDDQMNLYTYVHNDPLNYVDPDGQIAFLVPLVVLVVKELASEAVEQATGVPMPTLKNAAKGGIKLTIKMNAKWSKDQVAQAQQKVASLNQAAKSGELSVTKNPKRSSTSARRTYEAEKGKGSVGSGNDADHTKELQLGGTDTPDNISPLDSSVNRSIGAQIQQQIKNVPQGTKVCEVTICR